LPRRPSPHEALRCRLVDLAQQIIPLVDGHPAVRSIRLVGSRAEGRASERSDWDFSVETDDFLALTEALPQILDPLNPLAQQWDRLSGEWCWMVMLRGPVKVDLIFPQEPHSDEPPWEPNHANLNAIEAHFWDWMLWLSGKQARGNAELVYTELSKLSDHLLAPLGFERRPASIAEAIDAYREARDRAEQRFCVVVGRELETAVAPAFAVADLANPYEGRGPRF